MGNKQCPAGLRVLHDSTVHCLFSAGHYGKHRGEWSGPSGEVRTYGWADNDLAAIADALSGPGQGKSLAQAKGESPVQVEASGPVSERSATGPNPIPRPVMIEGTMDADAARKYRNLRDIPGITRIIGGDYRPYDRPYAAGGAIPPIRYRVAQREEQKLGGVCGEPLTMESLGVEARCILRPGHSSAHVGIDDTEAWAWRYTPENDWEWWPPGTPRNIKERIAAGREWERSRPPGEEAERIEGLFPTQDDIDCAMRSGMEEFREEQARQEEKERKRAEYLANLRLRTACGRLNAALSEVMRTLPEIPNPDAPEYSDYDEEADYDEDGDNSDARRSGI